MNTNHKQLSFAREYRGYSQSELASKIKGLSQSNLSKFEKGIGSLSDEVFERIVVFLNFPKEFFDKKIINEIENAHYRKRSSLLNKKERCQIEYSLKLIGYIVDRMGDSIEYPDFSLRKIDLEDGYTPSIAATYIRGIMGIKSGAVKDIFTILESYGIIIVEIDDFPDGFDGVSFYTDGDTPVIVLNKKSSNDRKRFSLAHELGHLVLHSDLFLIPTYRDKENEANEFASEFLMPAKEIKQSLYGLRLSYLADFKRYWLTSMSSIIRRASDLGCIDKNKYTYFNVELSRKGYKKEEPINVYIDSPNLYYDAYKMHKNELDYTNEELSNSFNLPIDVINRFLIQKPGSRLRIITN